MTANLLKETPDDDDDEHLIDIQHIIQANERVKKLIISLRSSSQLTMTRHIRYFLIELEAHRSAMSTGPTSNLTNKCPG